MPALPQNNTSRVFYDYITGDASTNGIEHTFAVRYVTSGATVPEVHQAVTDFLTAMGTSQFQTGWRLLRARVQLQGNNISLPTVLPPGLATFVGNGGNLPPYAEALETAWEGRSPTTGRRTSLSLFGLAGLSLDTGYRINAGAPGYGWVAATVAVLDADPDIFVSVDLSKADWYPYVNLNFNSYWEGRLRAGV